MYFRKLEAWRAGVAQTLQLEKQCLRLKNHYFFLVNIRGEQVDTTDIKERSFYSVTQI